MGRVYDAWNRAEAENLEMVRGSGEAVHETESPSASAHSPELLNHANTHGQTKATASGPCSNRTSRLQQPWNPDRNRLVFLDGNGNGHPGPVTEQFRGVSSRLYQLRQAHPIASILISSARSREGRTFVAVNLAHALVQQPGKRVLLIDADLRNPGIHKLLGTQAEPGLSDYLAGNVDAPSVIQKGPIKGLFLIPSGAVTIDAAELLANGRLKVLLERAAGFDWVVIDSPPASAVCDASIMAEVCDGILLVVEATKTPSEMAERVVQQFRNRPILGAVVNRSDAFHSHREDTIRSHK
jgi:capsular exopolysaccharide synthesis family protein